MRSISSVIGPVADRQDGEEQALPMTDILVHYLELMRLVYCSNGTSGWTDDDAAVLRK